MTFAIKDLTKRFRVGENTVLAWIHAGDIAAVNVAKRNGLKPQWRITEEALRNFELLRMKVPKQPRATRRRTAATLHTDVQFFK